MAIRFTPEYNKEIRNVVRNFNRKRNRAIQRGFRHLPEPLSTRELKSRYTTSSELNRELRLLRKFGSMRNDALKIVETTGGAKAIKWEYEHLKRNLRYAKAFYDREISDAIKLDTPLLIAKSEYINNLKAKRDYLDLEMSELTPSQLRTFRKTINGYLYANERNLNSYRNWMGEVEVIMRNLGYDNKTINEFFKGFDQLTPRQFLKMYQQSALVSRIYELYIPTNDKSFKLSTTEEDAKDLINTFMIEKDELIRKAKLDDLREGKALKEFTKSLAKKAVPQKKGPAKLKRKDLTPEQIKDLKDLGWEDLIE